MIGAHPDANLEDVLSSTVRKPGKVENVGLELVPRFRLRVELPAQRVAGGVHLSAGLPVPKLLNRELFSIGRNGHDRFVALDFHELTEQRNHSICAAPRIGISRHRSFASRVSHLRPRATHRSGIATTPSAIIGRRRTVDQERGIADDFRNCAPRARDDWSSTAHRLQNRETEALVAGRL